MNTTTGARIIDPEMFPYKVYFIMEGEAKEVRGIPSWPTLTRQSLKACLLYAG